MNDYNTSAVEDTLKYPDNIEPEQLDSRPGREHEMETKPIYNDDLAGLGRLEGKVALITGGDSGIGRAVAVAYAKEGAKVFIAHKEECEDAVQTMFDIDRLGGEADSLDGDVGDPAFARELVEAVIERFGQLDILVNNAGEQHPQDSILEISDEQLERTFRTNIFSMFYLVKAALPYLKPGSSIINTSSVTAYRGSAGLIDYSATKGAITSFTRSLALNLADQGIRVNQVAPGPVWTPLIVSTYDMERVADFGQNTAMGRAGQPLELAEAYIFLAWERASSFMTGQTIHVNGGNFINS
ncbi:MAG: SDR family oxidoreductase [Eubacteriales bacterium]|nr:SDR family oxidoreductase [Eubacteriales bacterium]